MNMVGYINANYRQTLMVDNDKENAEPSPPPQPKPQKVKKEPNSWDCPKIEYISQESFDQLNRHQRGSLKYAHLNQATDEVSFKATQQKKDNLPVQINEIIKQKYQLLHKVKGKPKLAKKYPNVERYQIDMADQQDRINKNKCNLLI